MVRIARAYSVNLDIRNLAESLIANIPQKSYWDEASTLQRFVRDNVRYTQDTYNVETLKTPLETLASRQGDCDDKSLLVAALLLSIGHPVRFRAIGYAPGQFEHVYAQTKIGNVWFGVETTEPVELGWEPEGVVASMIRNV